MHDTAENFKQKAAEKCGLNLNIQEFPDGTKTAEDAAEAIGCELEQIVKSIVMDCEGDIVVVLTSGDNKVSSSKLSEYLKIDEKLVSPADPRKVKEETGWSIGGVPPFCHEKSKKVIMDEKLRNFKQVWAAAGTPKAVFQIKPEKLEKLSEATVADVFE